MRYEHLDLNGRTYYVTETFKRHKFGSPKSGESRFVDLPAFLVEELKEYCMAIKRKSLKDGQGGNIDLLFVDPSEREAHTKVVTLTQALC